MGTNICLSIIREQPEAVIKETEAGSAAQSPYRGLSHDGSRKAPVYSVARDSGERQFVIH